VVICCSVVGDNDSGLASIRFSGRIQAMHVSLLEIALADSSKKNVTELPSDLTEAIKRLSNTDNIVSEKRRVKKTKAAVTREQVYTFAWGCIEYGHPEAAAAAVICFEWLQRPENVLAGYLRWSDYRGKEWPNNIKIEHHKTGATVLHPLEETTPDGIVKFYDDAEAVLAKLPRCGVPMILREVRKGVTKPYSFSGMQKIVHTMRDKIGLPSTFTLDACRHGGMTELEEAALTDGQGRALSAHKTTSAYAGYAKRTMERTLSATRKRHAHRLANAAGTSIQNEQQNAIQNEPATENKSAFK
jgi:hypothetical protein